ncbi:peptide ABC transporter permease [Bosea thiooxidans]|uniref:Peptide ABC transporter permease n=1 Tax=Bosea thiooxidans TaxID=53254 RepID=A0A0Q3I5Y1_9HYPH|nr:ABC transporter permease [Bosea thiooxidans]KQK30181.1 peptide ABC transporter permease [Bosea thiooxidans]SKC11289.1 peptide/nickel transport system permease protein [Bosea thiooxidans]
MTRYIVMRILSALIMALLATLVVFLIATQVPADPVLAQLGDLQASDPNMVAAYREKWGLDQPIWYQYFVFLQGLVQGDLGISLATHRPVVEDIVQYAPATFELATVSFALALAVAIPLGIAAAVKRDSWIDHVARVIAMLGVSAPTFWLAFIVLALFYGGLQIAPGPGRLDIAVFPPQRVTGLYLVDSLLSGQWETFTNAAAHLVLPSIVLAASVVGMLMRTVRAAMLETLTQDYIRSARAKGLSKATIVLRHALPNALIPIVTLAGIAYAILLTGAVMTETVFSWPGLGLYTFRSAVALDFPALMGITLIVAVIYLFINLVVDLSYTVIDPRVVTE